MISYINRIHSYPARWITLKTILGTPGVQKKERERRRNLINERKKDGRSQEVAGRRKREEGGGVFPPLLTRTMSRRILFSEREGDDGQHINNIFEVFAVLKMKISILFILNNLNIISVTWTARKKSRKIKLHFKFRWGLVMVGKGFQILQCRGYWDKQSLYKFQGSHWSFTTTEPT